MTTVDATRARRSTEDLVDDLAHQAGIAAKDEHVKGRGGLRSAAEARRTEHGSAKDVAKEGAKGIAEHAIPDVLEHWGWAVAGGVAFAAGSVVGAYHLYMHAWAEPNAKGDNLRALHANDAVNVAVARGLAFDPRFGEDEAKMRPDCEKGTGKLLEKMDADPDLRAILQARADEGFLVAERAHAATAHIADPSARAQAMQRWLKDNGFGDRIQKDIAFQKGAQFFLWSTAHGTAAAESAKVHARAPVERDVQTRG